VVDSNRNSDLERLAGKLAHDIRNPLHAIRLNLHTLRLSTQIGSPLPADEMELLFAESEQEIDRIERRMREFLAGASPPTPTEE
jgi:signal transduction histidine kinase